MTDDLAQAPVRIIGSRELHQNLATIMRELEGSDTRFILTVHGKPKAVLIGAETCLKMVNALAQPTGSMLGLQLSALMGRVIEDPLPGGQEE